LLQFKRGIMRGIDIRRGVQHLQGYLNEFSFRYSNRSGLDGSDRDRAARIPRASKTSDSRIDGLTKIRSKRQCAFVFGLAKTQGNSHFGVDLSPVVAYKLQMPTINRTEEFDSWLKGLRDLRARAKVLIRIDRLALGNPGDVAPVGEGVSEMRIDHGPGYRVYFKQRGDIATLLWGGDKDSQSSDIRKAKALANELEK
jgi:putative addiction module killer protein